jgi:xanthine dehydrogenase molybdenum-binding subunit
MVGRYKVIGTRPIRHDGRDKVTGRAFYGADVYMSGLLYGKILRSPYAHALIRSIDISRALALTGVKAVVTAKDLPQPWDTVTGRDETQLLNRKFQSNRCLAANKVLHKGHPIAAVAATDPYIAEDALSLIDVEYDVLPPVLNILDAVKEDAPILHDQLTTLTRSKSASQNPWLQAGGNGKASNIANHLIFEKGDLEKGFNEAHVVIEHEYTTVPVHQGYIEPHSATAVWQTDGLLTIWCSSQGHFFVREQVAMVLDIPVSKIKVVPMEIGGGFGGKIPIYLEPIAALLSRESGHPVKMTMTRGEVFNGTGPASGTYIKVKMGASKEGRITAAQAFLGYEAGAYPGSMERLEASSKCMFAPYDVSNLWIEACDVVVNTPKVAAYRAPGVSPIAFAMETVIDEICEKLNKDPLEFRLFNCAREGTHGVAGSRFSRIGFLETIQAASNTQHYLALLDGPNRGRGVACGIWMPHSAEASATANVNSDGTVSLVQGSVDIGGTRATAAMQLAEVLGIHAEDVRPSVGDTDSVGYTSKTSGSSVTFKTGWACYEVAQDLKRQMIQRAASLWGISPSKVDLFEGVFVHNSDPQLSITFRNLAARLHETGGPIVASVTVNPRDTGPAFACHIVDVEVDPETGKTQILRYTALQDVGKAIHPSYVEGQIQGGVAQGIGWALNEEYVFDEFGSMKNPTFLDYRMPTSLDLPMIETMIIEVPDPGHPYGVRGVGEVSIVPPIAAIASAIYRAVGVRMRRLPMSPSNVLQAIWDTEAS